MIWTLFMLVVMIGIAFLIWDYRRKIAAREATSKKRFNEMFRARSTAPLVQTQVPAPAARSLDVQPAAASVPSPKARFLGQPETLVYRLIKAGIPDHEVFANVSLASVIGGKNEEARRLAPYCLDFVICDKSMQVVAIVEVERAGGTLAAGEQRFVADRLREAGIHLVRLNPLALPRREDIRALFRGPSGAGGP